MREIWIVLLALAVEVPVVVGIAAWRRWTLRWKTLAAFAVAATLLTHPPIALATGRLTGTPGAMRWSVLEAAVILVEAGIYALPAGLGWRRGLVLSLAANVARVVATAAVFASG